MQIGVHGLVFTGTFDEAGLQTAIAGTQAAGAPPSPLRMPVGRPREPS